LEALHKESGWPSPEVSGGLQASPSYWATPLTPQNLREIREQLGKPGAENFLQMVVKNAKKLIEVSM